MANDCIDCRNWRKCSWSKNLSIPAVDRELPHVDGKPDFHYNLIFRSGNPYHDVVYCPEFDDETKDENGNDIRYKSTGMLSEADSAAFAENYFEWYRVHDNIEATRAKDIRIKETAAKLAAEASERGSMKIKRSAQR